MFIHENSTKCDAYKNIKAKKTADETKWLLYGELHENYMKFNLLMKTEPV